MAENMKSYDEAPLRQLIDSFVKAFCSKDLDWMMSLYTPDFHSFDVVPPLQTVGRDDYRDVWKNAFSRFKDPIEIELQAVHITMGNDLAFSHKLLRLHATLTNGQEVNYWERLTFCFRRVDSKWLIAHEHVSVPANLTDRKAVLDLTP